VITKTPSLDQNNFVSAVYKVSILVVLDIAQELGILGAILGYRLLIQNCIVNTS
jgi:hypothetical protein